MMTRLWILQDALRASSFRFAVVFPRFHAPIYLCLGTKFVGRQRGSNPLAFNR